MAVRPPSDYDHSLRPPVYRGTFVKETGPSQAIDFIATDILAVGSDRITDNWHLEDNLTFLQQIGLMSR